ncbi:MAG: DUF3048 domain-containing protein [Candidatus Magasanikbacteria bacterium]|nr:DUF3048 domain-containing protein [Candidatus Magasanikbacteria bacterium]
MPGRIWTKRFAKQRRNIFAALFVIVLGLLIWSGFLWWRLFVAEPKYAIEPISGEESAVGNSSTSTLAQRPIDGLMVPAEQATSSLFAVMIDNFPESRPAANLALALLVWEAPVEAGLTRLLAVYSSNMDLQRVGPIRSARPYFLDWAKELNAMYLHVGGSGDALKQIKEKDIFDLNEFYRGWYFWRDRSRARPHNVYTSSELVKDAFAKEGARQNFAPINLASWVYRPENSEAKIFGRFGKGLKIDFGQMKVEWKYNWEKKVYEKYEYGVLQKDESGAVIAAKNMALQITTIEILDEVGRRQIKTTGSGKAVVLTYGLAIEGVWQKKDASSRTRFFGPDTKEVVFDPGATWIEVIGDTYNYEITPGNQ